jgi:hypothetical protein
LGPDQYWESARVVSWGQFILQCSCYCRRNRKNSLHINIPLRCWFFLISLSKLVYQNICQKKFQGKNILPKIEYKWRCNIRLGSFIMILKPKASWLWPWILKNGKSKVISYAQLVLLVMHKNHLYLREEWMEYFFWIILSILILIVIQNQKLYIFPFLDKIGTFIFMTKINCYLIFVYQLFSFINWL